MKHARHMRVAGDGSCMGGSFDRSKMGKSHGCTDPVPNLSRLASASASGKFRRMDVDRVRYICWKNGLKIGKKALEKRKKKLYMFLRNLVFYWLFNFHIQLWSVHICCIILGPNKFRGTKWCELLEFLLHQMFFHAVEGTLTCLAGEGWREGTILLCWTRRGQGLRVCIWQSLSGLPSQVYSGWWFQRYQSRKKPKI